MFWPVVSATATMIGAFLPMLLWPGIPGKFMSYFPITLIIILSASMVVALIFLPVLGGFFGKAGARDEEQEKAIEASETGDWRAIPGITGWYARLSEKLTQHPFLVIAGAAAMVAAVIVIFAFGNKGTIFFADEDPDYLRVYISARGNLSADEKRDIVMGVSRIAQTIDGIRAVYATSGGQSNSLNSQGGEPVDNIGHLGIELKDYRQRRKGKVIADEIRRKTATIPGIHVELREQSNGPSSGKDIMIDVNSDDYVALAQVTQSIREHMDKMKTLRDVEDTRPLPGIEWDLDINREMASRFGANAQSIGTAVQLVTNGIMVGKYRPDDSQDEVDIRVRYPSEFRGIHALDDLRVAAADGSMVPISNFVTKKPAQQVNSIERVDGHRVYHVRANVKTGQNSNAQIAKIQSWINAQNFPAGVHVAFKGGAEEQDESQSFLGVAALLALFLIGIVLLTLFNSFYHMALILVAVILAMIGALLGMVVMGEPFSIIMSGTGMLALAGIVVNHNIVLIDTFHRLRDAGMEPIEAVIRSSAQRLRPVFLTTITAIGGLLPMMYAVEINFATREVTVGGPNGLMWVQLSTAIVFGLAFSKMITLGLVPSMLALPYRWRSGARASAAAGTAARCPRRPTPTASKTGAARRKRRSSRPSDAAPAHADAERLIKPAVRDRTAEMARRRMKRAGRIGDHAVEPVAGAVDLDPFRAVGFVALEPLAQLCDRGSRAGTRRFASAHPTIRCFDDATAKCRTPPPGRASDRRRPSLHRSACRSARRNLAMFSPRQAEEEDAVAALGIGAPAGDAQAQQALQPPPQRERAIVLVGDIAGEFVVLAERHGACAPHDVVRIRIEIVAHQKKSTVTVPHRRARIKLPSPSQL